MVYMEPHLLGWEPILASWINTLPETMTADHKTLITDLFNRYCPCLLNFIRKGGVHENTPTSDANLVNSCMNLMDCQLSQIADPATISGVSADHLNSWVEVTASEIISDFWVEFEVLG